MTALVPPTQQNRIVPTTASINSLSTVNQTIYIKALNSPMKNNGTISSSFKSKYILNLVIINAAIREGINPKKNPPTI